MTCTAIVLAGGASSRFGSDKLAASIDGRPLLHHVLSAVAEVADCIVLVLAPDAGAPDLPEDLGMPVVLARDAVRHGGPLAGLAAGIEAIDGGGTVLVAGADMPWLQPAVLRLLVETLDRAAALAAVTLAATDPAPLPMAIRPSVVGTAIDTILARGGRRSLRALLEAVPSATVPEATWRPLDPGARTLRDIDRPADLGGIS